MDKSSLPQKRIPSLSAVFPAYNDGGTIPSMILTALLAARQVTDDYEIIVINDGSSDHTAAVLNEMAAIYPKELRVIHHSQNKGYGATLRTGFSAATKEWVFYTDGDAQYNPLELVDLVNSLEKGIDVVNGYKISRSDPFIRKMIGQFYHHFVRIAFGFKLKDVDCDFRLIRQKIFKEIKLESETGSICLEMVKKFQDAGYIFAEVPVNHYYRQYGKSQFFNFKRIWRTGVHLTQLWQKLVWHKEVFQKEQENQY